MKLALHSALAAAALTIAVLFRDRVYATIACLIAGRVFFAWAGREAFLALAPRLRRTEMRYFVSNHSRITGILWFAAAIGLTADVAKRVFIVLCAKNALFALQGVCIYLTTHALVWSRFTDKMQAARFEHAMMDAMKTGAPQHVRAALKPAKKFVNVRAALKLKNADFRSIRDAERYSHRCGDIFDNMTSDDTLTRASVASRTNADFANLIAYHFNVGRGIERAAFCEHCVADLERRCGLWHTVVDYDRICDTINRAASPLTWFVVALVFLGVVLHVDVLDKGAALVSISLSFSFIFASTAQKFFEASTFVILRATYDVGDRIDIASGECKQENLVVHSIGVAETIFLDDHDRLCSIPHSILTGANVVNHTRNEP